MPFRRGHSNVCLLQHSERLAATGEDLVARESLAARASHLSSKRETTSASRSAAASASRRGAHRRLALPAAARDPLPLASGETQFYATVELLQAPDPRPQSHLTPHLACPDSIFCPYCSSASEAKWRVQVGLSGVSVCYGLVLTPLMRGLCQVSISPTRQLAVRLEAKAAFLSEYGAEKGESSFLLGI